MAFHFQSRSQPRRPLATLRAAVPIGRAGASFPSPCRTAGRVPFVRRARPVFHPSERRFVGVADLALRYVDWFRRIADIADRGLGRVNWGRKRTSRGRNGRREVRPIAGIPNCAALSGPRRTADVSQSNIDQAQAAAAVTCPAARPCANLRRCARVRLCCRDCRRKTQRTPPTRLS